MPHLIRSLSKLSRAHTRLTAPVCVPDDEGDEKSEEPEGATQDLYQCIVPKETREKAPLSDRCMGRSTEINDKGKREEKRDETTDLERDEGVVSVI